MPEKSTMGEKVYHTLSEFERAFFPDSYKRGRAEAKLGDAKAFGTGLATELLEKLRQRGS